jgi:hypothetical protein
MKNSFIKRIGKGLYKSFLIFMVCISMASNPAITNEIRKMLDYLKEVRAEQAIESDTDEDEQDEDEP